MGTGQQWNETRGIERQWNEIVCSTHHSGVVIDGFYCEGDGGISREAAIKYSEHYFPRRGVWLISGVNVSVRREEVLPTL